MVLKKIYEACMPIYYRLSSFGKDIHSGTFKISEADKSVLYESLSYAISLKVIFEEYFEQAPEAQNDTLYLPIVEFQTILSLAKIVESSQRISFLGVGVWDH